MSKTMTVAEAAQALGISKEAVRKRIQRGKLTAYKQKDEWFVLPQDEAVQNNRTSPATPMDGYRTDCPGQEQDRQDKPSSDPGQPQDKPVREETGTLAAGMAVNQAIQAAVTMAMAPWIAELSSTREDMRRLYDELVIAKEQIAATEQRAAKAEQERDALAVEVQEWVRRDQENKARPWWKFW